MDNLLALETPKLLALLTLFVGVPLNVVVTVMLFRESRRHPQIRVLRERFITAAAVLLVVIVFGLIFVNNDQPIPPLDLDATKIITRAAMLIVGIVAAAYWLWLYLYRGKLGQRRPTQRGESTKGEGK